MRKKLFCLFVSLFTALPGFILAQEGQIYIESGHPDFDIKIKRCAAGGNTVIIDMVWSNKGTVDVPTNILLYNNWAIVYDDEGNQYSQYNGYSNNAPLAVKYGKGQYTSYGVGFDMISGVPTKVSLRIIGVPTSIESIAKILLNVSGGWGLHKKVEIRNVPITRN